MGNCNKDIKSKKRKFRRCPFCGKRYDRPSAISRKDNKTKICPDCGTQEALIDAMFMENENHIPRID